MSRKGNCLDNALMEGFFGTLKCETIYIDKPKTILCESPDRQQQEDNTKEDNNEEKEVDREANRSLLPGTKIEEPSKVGNPREEGTKTEPDEKRIVGTIQGALR